MKKIEFFLVTPFILLTSCSSLSKDPSLTYLDKPEEIKMYQLEFGTSIYKTYSEDEESKIYSYFEYVGFKEGEYKEYYEDSPDTYYAYLKFIYEDYYLTLLFNSDNYCYYTIKTNTFYSEENFFLADVLGYCFNNGNFNY